MHVWAGDVEFIGAAAAAIFGPAAFGELRGAEAKKCILLRVRIGF